MNFTRARFVCLFVFQIYIATTFSQFNLGNNIAVIPTDNNFTYPQSVFIDSPNGHIWITDFDNNRVLRFDVSVLTTINESLSASVPSFYFLDQNYPNPFNSTTIIKFSTKKTGGVELVVHDLLGQKIATLFNNVAAANEVYSIAFDAKNLPSGTYFYSLYTENGIEVKRMCLLK